MQIFTMMAAALLRLRGMSQVTQAISHILIRPEGKEIALTNHNPGIPNRSVT
jgi:hypothetical protein